MTPDAVKVIFLHELRRVLTALYDPGTLRRSPLIRLLGVDGREDEIAALQRILIDAIEALKPGDNVPAGSNTWRVHRILYDRYVDQCTQQEVAADLALSTRQLRRQEKIAQEILADYLWTHYDLEQKASLLDRSTQIELVKEEEERTPSRAQELAWLKRTLPNEPIDVQKMVKAVLETADPLLNNLHVGVYHEVPAGPLALLVPSTAARQALLHVLTVAATCVPSGEVHLAVEAIPQRALACLRITAHRHTTSLGHPSNANREDLEMAHQLIQVANGSLQTHLDPSAETPFTATILLPTAERLPVLVIDDNADTLQLMQRYLSDSRYHFVGTSDPERALALAEELSPAIIVLDVMLPGVDGWELLGRLREHPKTSDIPVIVCTILPQRQLALMLGAAEFIRKPVTRKILLSALDRQVDRWLIKPR